MNTDTNNHHEQQPEIAEVTLEDFCETMDLQLNVGRVKPSNRTEKHPHTYMAWMPKVCVVTDVDSMILVVGFGDSVEEALQAITGAMSEATLRIDHDNGQELVVAPVLCNIDFGT